MKSQIFYTDAYKDIQLRVQELLNSHEDFLSPSTARSTSAVGDAIESVLGSSFDIILGDLCKEYSATFARRAMADLAFTDVDDFYYVVDVKTHRTDTKFNIPRMGLSHYWRTGMGAGSDRRFKLHNRESSIPA